MIEEYPPEFEGQEEVLQPETILRHEDKVLRNGKIIRRYLIKFKNYPFEDAIWRDARWMQGIQLKDVLSLVKAYNDSLWVSKDVHECLWINKVFDYSLSLFYM